MSSTEQNSQPTLHNLSLVECILTVAPCKEKYFIFIDDFFTISVNQFVDFDNFLFNIWRFDALHICQLCLQAILFTTKVFARNLLRRSRRKNIFIFWFWYLTWDVNSELSSNKPTLCLLDYGEILPKHSNDILTTCYEVWISHLIQSTKNTTRKRFTNVF